MKIRSAARLTRVVLVGVCLVVPCVSMLPKTIMAVEAAGPTTGNIAAHPQVAQIPNPPVTPEQQERAKKLFAPFRELLLAGRAV
jgi:hypothetical protein